MGPYLFLWCKFNDHITLIHSICDDMSVIPTTEMDASKFKWNGLPVKEDSANGKWEFERNRKVQRF